MERLRAVRHVLAAVERNAHLASEALWAVAPLAVGDAVAPDVRQSFA